MGRKALKRRLGRNPTAAELDYDRVVKAGRRKATKARKNWVKDQLSRPLQQPRAEKAYTAPVLLSPGPAAPVVVKQLSDTDRRVVAAMQARLQVVAHDPAKRALLEAQIAQITGLTYTGGV